MYNLNKGYKMLFPRPRWASQNLSISLFQINMTSLDPLIKESLPESKFTSILVDYGKWEL